MPAGWSGPPVPPKASGAAGRRPGERDPHQLADRHDPDQVLALDHLQVTEAAVNHQRRRVIRRVVGTDYLRMSRSVRMPTSCPCSRMTAAPTVRRSQRSISPPVRRACRCENEFAFEDRGVYAGADVLGSPVSIGLLIGSWLHSNQPPS
jgi:hypothetical protein